MLRSKNLNPLAPPRVAFTYLLILTTPAGSPGIASDIFIDLKLVNRCKASIVTFP